MVIFHTYVSLPEGKCFFLHCHVCFSEGTVLRPSLNPLKLAFYPTKSGMKVEKCSLKAGYDMTYQLLVFQYQLWGFTGGAWIATSTVNTCRIRKKRHKNSRGILFFFVIHVGFWWVLVVCFEYSHVQTHGLLPRIELCRCPRSVMRNVGRGSRAAEHLYEWPERTRTNRVSPWIKDDVYRFTLR